MFSRVWKPDETLALVFEIVHKELERKVEKLKHMKLEVIQLKIKNKSELPARE